MGKSKRTSLVKVGRRAEVSENIQNNWELLDIDSLVFSQNNVVCMFGGNTTNRHEAANGNAKGIESFLPEGCRGKTDIYSFVYETEPIKAGGYLSKEYEVEAHAIYEKLFRPLLFDSKGYMKEKAGIESVFNKLILAAHCGGGNFVNVIIDRFYETLTEKYSPATAEMLINKIQYWAYAPCEMPRHNVKALIIAPYADISCSWARALSHAETQKVDVDYPKGIVKKIFKAKDSGQVQEMFESTFKENRAIMFKIGQTTFLIPSCMNPNLNVGDHSWECVVKTHILHSGTEYENTAKIVNYASKAMFHGFVSNSAMDAKDAFYRISKKIAENPPADVQEQ